MANKGLTAISCMKLIRYDVSRDFRNWGQWIEMRPLKTKNPRKKISAGRHFFSTNRIPFHQHPESSLFFLTCLWLFAKSFLSAPSVSCVEALPNFLLFYSGKNCIIMQFVSKKSFGTALHNAVFDVLTRPGRHFTCATLQNLAARRNLPSTEIS